jgi:hypothetical protein
LLAIYSLRFPIRMHLTEFFFFLATIVQFLLEARKVKLLSELQTIYPIERLENGEYAIRGLELPTDL